MELSDEQAVYARGLRTLVDAGVPFLVGGGWALFHYLGRWRTTKDIDVFVAPELVDDTLDALAKARFGTELTDPTWLGKAFQEGALIDVIFCSYNGLFPVDDDWYSNARDAEVLGVEVRVVGPEEMIVSKSFVAARDRFDGADVAWLMRATADSLDWNRIEWLMRDHWEILLWQLLHYCYVFPSERRRLPRGLLKRLMSRWSRELLSAAARPDSICRGPMLDPKLYRREIEASGEDPRPRRDLALLVDEC